ncbi:long-chain fatty acid--CoA ligase [Halorubrum rutilum]|uniref:Long-chain fatty acid--CoA ligase n=1 Tax=Halorubrum rutilum TaxID=1364933 RepID=A0ABD6AKE9_9EURY|nr:long-chain fatty acid--CoA ligase [Halorubrum rutilum]
MDVVGDLLARDRRSSDIALVTPDGRERTYRDLITNAYKAANVLRYLGAREGSTVAVEPAPGFHTTLAVLGAAGLGAPVRFDPATGIERGDRVVLVDAADEPATEPAPGTSLAVFGGPPERPETTHWEQELWSENPGMPPSSVGPDDPVLRGTAGGGPDGGDGASGGTGDVSHRALLGAAASVADERGLEPGDEVVLRGDLSDPRALAAGVVAPLAAGATAVLAGEGAGADAPTVTVVRNGDDGGSRPVTLPTVRDR